MSCIHLGALLDKDTRNERIWAAAGPFTLSDILAIFRKHHPDRAVADDTKLSEATISIDQPLGLALLKKQGRSGYTSLEECVLDNVRGL